MKKQVRKVVLSRETLTTLTPAKLDQVPGGVATHPPVCETTGNC